MPLSCLRESQHVLAYILGASDHSKCVHITSQLINLIQASSYVPLHYLILVQLDKILTFSLALCNSYNSRLTLISEATDMHTTIVSQKGIWKYQIPSHKIFTWRFESWALGNKPLEANGHNLNYFLLTLLKIEFSIM